MAAAESRPVPEGFQTLKEGQATILQRIGTNEVFYNNAQVTNRDLSVCVLRHFLPLRAKEYADMGPKNRKQLKQQQRREKKKVCPVQRDVPAGSAAAAAAADGSGEKPQEEEGAAAAAEGAAVKAEVAAADGAADAEAAPAAADGAAGAEASTSGAAGAAAGGAQAAPAGAKVLEALAATGLRAIRYALEVPGIAQVDANDLDANAVESIRRNAAFNGVSACVHTIRSDARLTMLQSPLAYDVVDLDPYGTPAGLLDSAVQCVRDGGLLCVTATDMANLCGNNGVTAYGNYGAYPIHRPYCHEMALRILLACIETHATRYRRHIEPLLSLSVDFYIRVFVRVHTAPMASKDTPCKLAYVWQSSGCDSFYLQAVGQKKVYGTSTKYMPGHGPAVPQECPETGSGFLMGGPIWSEPLHDQSFVAGMLQELERDKAQFAAAPRITGMLRAALEELPDVPLYYNLHDICKTVKCQPPKGEVFRSALVNAGYRVSGSHANANALKTDAPPNVIWDIIRCWIQQHPVSTKEKHGANPYAIKLLAKAPVLQADFTRASAAISKSKAQGFVRFVENPAYWGPMARHNRPMVEKPDQPPQSNTSRKEQKKRQRGGADGAAAGGGGEEEGGAEEEDEEEGPSGKRAATEAEAAGGAAPVVEATGAEAGAVAVATAVLPVTSGGASEGEGAAAMPIC